MNIKLNLLFYLVTNPNPPVTNILFFSFSINVPVLLNVYTFIAGLPDKNTLALDLTTCWLHRITRYLLALQLWEMIRVLPPHNFPPTCYISLYVFQLLELNSAFVFPDGNGFKTSTMRLVQGILCYFYYCVGSCLMLYFH